VRGAQPRQIPRNGFFENLCSFGLCHHPRVALLAVADDRAAHPPGERRGRIERGSRRLGSTCPASS
jgi:hypothetical protein